MHFQPLHLQNHYSYEKLLDKCVHTCCWIRGGGGGGMCVRVCVYVQVLGMNKRDEELRKRLEKMIDDLRAKLREAETKLKHVEGQACEWSGFHNVHIA